MFSFMSIISVANFFKKSIFTGILSFIKKNAVYILFLTVVVGTLGYHQTVTSNLEQIIEQKENKIISINNVLITTTDNLEVCKEQQIELKIKAQVNSVVQKYDNNLVHELMIIDNTSDFRELF